MVIALRIPILSEVWTSYIGFCHLLPCVRSTCLKVTQSSTCPTLVCIITWGSCLILINSSGLFLTSSQGMRRSKFVEKIYIYCTHRAGTEILTSGKLLHKKGLFCKWSVHSSQWRTIQTHRSHPERGSQPRGQSSSETGSALLLRPGASGENPVFQEGEPSRAGMYLPTEGSCFFNLHKGTVWVICGYDGNFTLERTK